MILFRSFVVFLLIVNFTSSKIRNKGWWHNLVFYQVFPRSFMDSNNDGTGDIRGIIDKLEHFVDLGVGAIWMSPVNTSPLVDNGYDISNYVDIDPVFGNLDDFDTLIKKAKKLGIKVIMDFVPNHTSNKHEWFTKSVNSIGQYKDYYIWKRGKKNNTQPPNNWVSLFHGPAWTFNKKRGLWYLHQFEKRQVDLNLTNPLVQEEIFKVLKFWLSRGVNGFRIDAIDHLYEDDRFLDEPASVRSGRHIHSSLQHIYTINDPRNFDLFASWRKLVDDWTDSHNGEERILLTESYHDATKYYTFGSNVPFNFHLFISLSSKSRPSKFKRVIENWLSNVPENKISNWVSSNHDRERVTRRFRNKPDLILMLVMILPGVSCVYYGEEIAMEDNRRITWKETHDQMACATTPETYQSHTRDPSRTPFQWDGGRNANFSNAEKTWLPVNRNYVTLNLEIQKAEKYSAYKLFKKLAKLKKTSKSLIKGSLKIEVLHRDTILVISRQSSSERVVLLNNFLKTPQTVDSSPYLPGVYKAKIYVTSRRSGIEWGISVSPSNVELPPFTSVLIVGTTKKSE